MQYIQMDIEQSPGRSGIPSSLTGMFTGTKNGNEQNTGSIEELLIFYIAWAYFLATYTAGNLKSPLALIQSFHADIFQITRYQKLNSSHFVYIQVMALPKFHFSSNTFQQFGCGTEFPNSKFQCSGEAGSKTTELFVPP